MNRECGGHQFTIINQTFYRCLVDSRIMPEDFDKSNVCPNCGRPKDPDVATVKLIRIKLSGSPRTIDVRPKDLGLEEQS